VVFIHCTEDFVGEDFPFDIPVRVRNSRLHCETRIPEKNTPASPSHKIARRRVWDVEIID
jgi:hypothetical protein